MADLSSASAVLDVVGGRWPRVLALGEPAHGADGLLAMRNSLFRELVEHGGYRIVAVESDCLAGLVTDSYVCSGMGALDDVMSRGFSHHELGAECGNRALVRWMRSYNAGRAAGERVRFAGFDGPVEMTGAASPREALTRLYSSLASRVPAEALPCDQAKLDSLLGADPQWTDPAVVRQPGRSVGRGRSAERLRVIADDLAFLVSMYEPELGDEARLYARTATGLLRYHHWMADTSPERWERLAGVRASMMAANLLALAERGPVLVHAHNAHLQRHRSGMRMGDRALQWWGAGAIVSGRLGADYAFLATALGQMPHRGVEAPPPDTVEGILYARRQNRLILGPGEMAALLDGSPAPRSSPWYGYAPLDPAHAADADGIVFVADASAGDLEAG